MNIIERNLRRIIEICRNHKVNQLCAFGSVLTDKFNDQSDVDFLVDFSPDVSAEDYADNYFNLRDALATLLKRDVDLVEDRGISNPYFRLNVDRNKVRIYG